MDEVNPSDLFTTHSIHTWNNAVFYQTVNVAFSVAGKWHDLTDCEMSLRYYILPLYIQTIVRIVVMFEMLAITQNFLVNESTSAKLSRNRVDDYRENLCFKDCF